MSSAILFGMWLGGFFVGLGAGILLHYYLVTRFR